MTGLIYFIVIICANTIGAVSGMGGGVIIKPIFDFIGADNVVTISFYSTMAVFTMSVVSTGRQIKNGVEINWKEVGLISFGSVIGGITGNIFFEEFLKVLPKEENVTMIQIIITVVTLIFAFVYTRFELNSFNLSEKVWGILCGFILGFLASFLGIGGGPINVALLMWMFAMPIKKATVYSICIILFSQLAKIITIAIVSGFARYDLMMLWYIIPAAIIGGLVGAQASRLLSPKRVTSIFQLTIIGVLIINLYNFIQLFQ